MDAELSMTRPLEQTTARPASPVAEAAATVCPHHQQSNCLTRCMYGSSGKGKKGCTNCRLADAEKALTETKRRLLALEHQVLHVPSDKQDATLALNSLYGSLENIVVHVREASVATFTSKRRLDKIRQDVKTARAHADRLQEVIVALSKVIDQQKKDAAAKLLLAQDPVLKEMHRALNGQKWVKQDGWMSDQDIAQWHGISGKGGSILKLELNVNNLAGTLPRSICLLTALEELALAKNALTGPLPSALGDLINLKMLYLADNQLSGNLPESLSKLTKLKVMYLSNNKLSGPIPSSLSTLKRLEIMGLAKNSLTGAIPESFSKLVSLKKLDLSANLLTGAVPLAIAEMPQLEELRLSEGQVPVNDEEKLLEISPLVTIQRVVPKGPPVPTAAGKKN